MARAIREKFKPYNLIFYQDERYIYEELKKVSKATRRNMRDTILVAIETYLGGESFVQSYPQNNDKKVDTVDFNDDMELW